MLSEQVKNQIRLGAFDEKLSFLYVCGGEGLELCRQRLFHAVEEFEKRFGEKRDIAVFSAPGRTEIGGNHTDHQRGRVLAGSVNLDVIAVVSENGENRVRIKSEGYPMDSVNTEHLDANSAEKNTSLSLIRGILGKFEKLGCRVGGFDAYTTSNVLSGSGLSSSAAFEVLVGTIVNSLFRGGADAVKIAQIGQFAENVYFGKPCGLMDQAASSVGGLISIDFYNAERPLVKKIDFDFTGCGYSLFIIDTAGSHADLTPDYAAIPAEMKQVAAFFGKEVLSEVDEADFFASLKLLRAKMGDRCILRAIHFFAENKRVAEETAALESGNFPAFLKLVRESGYSSYMYLQNVFSPSHVQQQGVSVVLALCERLLGAGGAYRVHGGGFAGTVQSFVPTEYAIRFTQEMEAMIGPGRCHLLSIRPEGGVRIL